MLDVVDFQNVVIKFVKKNDDMDKTTLPQAKGDDRYPVVVRMEKVNYAGVATNNFALDELVVIPDDK